MRLLIVTLALAVTTNVGLAGVDYYSGTGSPATFNLDSTPNGNWSPINLLTDVQAKKSGSSPNVRLDGSSSTGGSLTPYDLYFGSNSSSVLLAYTDAGAPSGSGLGVTVTAPGSAGGAYVFDDSTTGFEADLQPFIYDGAGGIASGYSGAANNYFVWHATTTGGAIYATGWANFSYSDDGSDVNGIDGSGDSFTILSWAYNLGQSTVIGQTELNSTGGGGSVPEPTGLAVLGLVGLAVGLKRRKRR